MYLTVSTEYKIRNTVGFGLPKLPKQQPVSILRMFTAKTPKIAVTNNLFDCYSTTREI